MSREELKLGRDIFEKRIKRSGKLEVRFVRYDNRDAYYVEITSGQKKVDIVLTDEFLEDLPAMKDYQGDLEEYANSLEKRFENVSPSLFYCRSGTPLTVEITWPFERYANRAASYIRVLLQETRFPKLVGKCAVVVTEAASRELRGRPFYRLAAVVNKIREAIDEQHIKFYSSELHPRTLQEVWIKAEGARREDASTVDIQQFVAGKVYWLGFKQADRTTRVWIPDPWDAAYLGVEVQLLKQSADILEARGIITLHDGREFASAGDGLLLAANSFETEPRPQRKIGFNPAE